MKNVVRDVFIALRERENNKKRETEKHKLKVNRRKVGCTEITTKNNKEERQKEGRKGLDKSYYVITGRINYKKEMCAR